MEGYFLYIIRCRGNKLYIGITNNLQKRWKSHLFGQGALYTKIHRPTGLVYFEKYDSFLKARQREIQIKKWRRDKKERLIAGLKP